MAADEHPGYGYAREGQPATLEVPKPHIRINMISAISNEGLLRFMTYKGNMNGALFLVFLRQLLRGATRKIYLIADRLKAHDTEEVRRWLGRCRVHSRDYERRTDSSEAQIQLSMIQLMLRRSPGRNIDHRSAIPGLPITGLPEIYGTDC